MALYRAVPLTWVLMVSACAGASGPASTAATSAAVAPTAAALAVATPAAPSARVLTPASSLAQTLNWTKAPPAYPAGAEIVVIEGDTTKLGPFTLRLRFPDGYAMAPHSHPFDEHVTVIQGTFAIGMGRTAQRESTQEMPAGSFVLIPSRTEHYIFMKGVTVVQAHGIGPAALMYVSPSDDPRNAPAVPSAPNLPPGPLVTP